MSQFSINLARCPSGKLKAKSLSVKFPKQTLKEFHYLDTLLTAGQKKKKENQIKKGGSLILTFAIPIVKKIVEYLNKKKEGSGLNKHEGGFLPLLLAALGAIGTLAGGAAAITTAVHNKQKNDAELAEQKRHNMVTEKKTGNGIFLETSQFL